MGSDDDAVGCVPAMIEDCIGVFGGGDAIRSVRWIRAWEAARRWWPALWEIGVSCRCNRIVGRGVVQGQVNSCRDPRQATIARVVSGLTLKLQIREVVAAAIGLSATLSIGCQSAGDYRREADEVAYDIIEQKQQEGLGRTEPFTVEQPAETLRKRLIELNALPYADPASLGSAWLEPIPQWPDDDYLDPSSRDEVEPLVTMSASEPLRLSLFEALQVAARNSRPYQDRKEAVFLAALDLDLERDFFRPVFGASLDNQVTADLTDGDTFAGNETTGALSLTQRFRNGVTVTGLIGADLVKLLHPDHDSSLGLFADASVSVPLLRGAGRFIATEPLTQAERDALYAIYEFETFKRDFAVDIADEYLSVLQQLDQVENAADNYERLVTAARRARALEQAGTLPPIQVDQAVQDELRARDRWIAAQQAYERDVDNFKLTLGLPTDAEIELEPAELTRLAEAAQAALERVTRGDASLTEPSVTEDGQPQSRGLDVPSADDPVTLVPPSREDAGPFELDERVAIELALEHRLDLAVSAGEVFDAQRAVAVRADRLRPELTLVGSAATGERRGLGSARLDDSTRLRLDRATYDALLTLDLPLERTAERNLYRESLIALEQSVRDYQSLEDTVKFQVRADLRQLLVSREGLRIQAQAVEVAERRVDNANLLLQAGRADIRDVLEAQEDLIDAQNALTNALVSYRVSELELQRDIGLLQVDSRGLWQEFDPTELIDDANG